MWILQFKWVYLFSTRFVVTSTTSSASIWCSTSTSRCTERSFIKQTRRKFVKIEIMKCHIEKGGRKNKRDTKLQQNGSMFDSEWNLNSTIRRDTNLYFLLFLLLRPLLYPCHHFGHVLLPQLLPSPCQSLHQGFSGIWLYCLWCNIQAFAKIDHHPWVVTMIEK